MSEMNDDEVLTESYGEHVAHLQDFQLEISKSQKKKWRQRSKEKSNYITRDKVYCFKPLQ